MYDKLINEASGGGVSNVTYTYADGITPASKEIGTLRVKKGSDTSDTVVRIPTIDIDALDKTSFNNPKSEPILVFKSIKDDGTDLEVYCEDPDGAVVKHLIFKDTIDDKFYSLKMENGVLISEQVTAPEPTSNPGSGDEGTGD
jgi:hypothetical protein